MKLTTVTEPTPRKSDTPCAAYNDEQLRLVFDSLIVENKKSVTVQKEIRYRQSLSEKTDVSELPLQTMKDIQKNLTAGAKDSTQLWANALELVHKAYEISQCQRPEITMDGAWKQYEENIEFAVKTLAKFRGVDGDWRSTALTDVRVTEAKGVELDTFSLESDIDGLPVSVTRQAANIDKVIQPFFDHNVTGCDIEIKHRGHNHVILYFCNENGRTGDKVTIKKVS